MNNPIILRQEAAEVAVRAQALVDKAEKEGRGFDKDAGEHAEWQRLFEQHGVLIERAETIEKQNTMSAAADRLGEVRKEAVIPQTDGPGIPNDELTGREKLVRFIMGARPGEGIIIGNAFEPESMRQRASKSEPAQKRRLERMERRQKAYYATQGVDEYEARALGIGTDTAGGYLVDDDIASYIEKAMKQYGGIFNTRAQVIPTMTGSPIDYPTLNDTTNKGALLAENTKATQQDLVFANVVLQAYKYTSFVVLVSLEMLQDSAFDVESLLFDCLAERIGRIVGEHTVTGTGSSQPQGIATAATAGVTLTAGSTAITYANVLSLYGSTDPAYDMMAEWAFNKATKVKLMGVLDGDNRPLFRFDLTPDGPVASFGSAETGGVRPYTIIQEMASQGNGNKFMLWGDFSKHKIRQAMAMELFRQSETHIESAQIGFVGFARYDSRFVDGGGGAVKAMAQAM